MTFAKENFSKLQPAGIELRTFCLQGRHANPHAMNVLNGGKNNFGHHYKITVKSVQEIFISLDISHVYSSGDKAKVRKSQFLISNFFIP